MNCPHCGTDVSEHVPDTEQAEAHGFSRGSERRAKEAVATETERLRSSGVVRAINSNGKSGVELAYPIRNKKQ